MFLRSNPVQTLLDTPNAHTTGNLWSCTVAFP